MRRSLTVAVAAGVLGSVGLVGTPAAAAGVPAAAGTVRSAPLAMDGFEDYDWWYEAMHIGQAHRKGATGEGATVALIDDALASVRELRGQDVRRRTSCRGGRAETLTITREMYAREDEADHGTSMASLIVGSGEGNAPGGVGTAGVAPRARLLAYDAGGCPGEELGNLVDQAVQDGADIVSVSLGVDKGIAPAVKRALEAGVVVVAAVPPTYENLGLSTYPASLRGVVAVQAVDRNANAPSWTSRDENSVIAAPGVEVGVVRWNPATENFDSRGYARGTSQSTAIVSGALAAVKSKYPEATGNQLVQHLIHKVGTEPEFDWNSTYGFGIVSVTEMLKSSPTQWPDENPLLEGPRAAIKNYPAWVSSKVPDPPGKGENAPEAGGEGAGSDGGQAGGTDGTEADGSDGGADAAGQDEDSGIPVWVWPVAGLVVLVAAGGAVLARRRGGSAA